MTSIKRNETSWVKRHPASIILVVVIGAMLLLDILSATAYRAIFEYDWADRKEYQVRKAERRQEHLHKLFRIPSEVYHHDLAKNKVIENVTWGANRFQIATNSLGFMDRSAREVPLRSDQKRLVFMGDSFTEGSGYPFDETFVGIISASLEKKGVEVLNAGVGSYSPIIYWRKTKYLIEEAGLKFDQMAVFLDISDAQDEARFYYLDERGNVAMNKDHPKFEASKNPPPERKTDRWKFARDGVKRHTIFLYATLKGVRDVLSGRTEKMEKQYPINLKRSLWTLDDDVFQDYGEEGLGRMTLYMDRLLELLRSRGIGLMVAVYPWPEQIIREDLESIQVKFWRDWSEENQVPFLNYFPSFINKGSTIKEKEKVLDRYFLAGDVHWNSEGNRLIGEKFLEFYEREKEN